MVEQIQEVFWLTSADDQQLLYVSPTFETIWGRPLESLYTYPGGYLNLIVDSIHPSDRERVVAIKANHFEGEYKAEYRIVRPDGSIRWVRSRSFPIQNPFGETWAIAGLSEDISDRLRADQLLHQRQQEFITFVEHSPDIVSRFDRELRHVYVNPAIEVATGMPSEAFIGKTHGELGMPPELISLWQPSIEKVFQTSQPEEHEFSYLSPQGCKYYHSRLFPELAANGSVESVLGICRDITKTKQTEEALRESEQRFRTVFEFAPMGIALTNSQGKFFASNRAFQEMLGYTEEELQNQDFRQFTPPEERALDLTLFEEMLTGKRNRISQEKRYLRKDGCVVWGKVSVSAVCDANGSFEYAIAMLQDITAHKQAQLELQNARAELEKRVAERTAELEQANLLLKQEIAERSCAQAALKAQTVFLQTLIDTNPNIIFVKDQQGRFVLANLAFAELYGLKVEELLGHTDAEIHPNQAEVERFEREDREACCTRQTKIVSETTFITPTGAVRYINGIKKPLFLPNEQNCLVLAVGTDVTELKLLTEKLKAQKEFLQTVLDTTPNLIWVKDSEDRIVMANPALADFFETTVEDLLGKTNPELHANPADAESCIAQDKEVLARLGEKFIPEEAFPTPSGEVRWFQTIKKPLFSSNGQITQVLGVSTDITEHKLAQKALHLSEARFRLAIDNIPHVFVIYDAQRRIQFVNAQGLRTSGKSLEEHLGYTDEEIWPDEVTKSYLPILKHAVETRTPQTAECTISVPNTSIFTMIVSYVPLLNERDEIYQILAITHDITERKQAETQIKEALREKEVLLQEIHHRVKNNLQVISSLLDLQSQHIHEPAMLEVFRESQDRVRTMALIHEQLYQSQDCARINFSEYITELTNYLFRAYGVNVCKITLELDVEEVSLNINTAIPCGLIISELISNALKYAFPQGNDGVIKIALHSDSAHQITLQVIDNGIGFPDNYDFNKVQSLGLQLVNVLTKQIEGSLQVNRHLGTAFTITFSEVRP